MPITSKTHVVEELRHSEYYNMQSTFDDLYARSKNGETFENLMEAILSRENILLAYRNIKANHGSRTPGTDGRTIQDIANMESEEVVEYVRFIVIGSKHGYRPKPVRRKEIPKQNGKTRPLGIPCIWDRLVQQCIKQILEPICEAKFSDNSYGFRPNRCVEHAIAETHRLMQRSHMHYVIEFDIKGFFDNVNHSKLIKQLWTMGIQDRQLIFVIKRILKAPIRMPNGSTLIPSKGTPQGGIISPLLANVVLNELDWWIEKQWYSNPVIEKFNCPKNKKGVTIKSGAYAAMRKTNLKEMYIIRYADDFRVFCRTKNQANRARIAITKWLEERLKLEVSEEKTRIVNVTTHYMEFLGFKLKLYSKGNKWRVKSHISDKKFILIRCNLKREYGNIAHAKNKAHATSLVRKYNATVLGIQNYYKIATDICKDCRKLQYVINAISKSQFHAKNSRLSKIGKTGRELTSFETKQYGRSRALRFLKSNGEPIYPIAFVQPSPPLSKTKRVCAFTPEGRKGLHDNLGIDTSLLSRLMRNPSQGQSVEFNDNKLSLFSAQWGRCGVTQRKFANLIEIHCHHKIPKEKGGTDAYQNLVLLSEPVHKLVHATRPETIQKYLDQLHLTKFEIVKLNKLRELVNLPAIVMT